MTKVEKLFITSFAPDINLELKPVRVVRAGKRSIKVLEPISAQGRGFKIIKEPKYRPRLK